MRMLVEDSSFFNVQKMPVYLIFISFQAWGSEKCNKVGGSDGGYYPPGIHPTDKISLFVPGE